MASGQVPKHLKAKQEANRRKRLNEITSPINRKRGVGKQADRISIERVLQVLKQEINNENYAVMAYLGVETLRIAGYEAVIRQGKDHLGIYPFCAGRYFLQIPHKEVKDMEDRIFNRHLGYFKLQNLKRWDRICDRLRVSSSALSVNHSVDSWLKTLQTYIHLNPRPIDLIWAWRKLRPQIENDLRFEKEINTIDHHLTPPWLEGEHEKLEQALKSIEYKLSSSPMKEIESVLADFSGFGIKYLLDMNHTPNVKTLTDRLSKIRAKKTTLNRLKDATDFMIGGWWVTQDPDWTECVIINNLQTAITNETQ